MVLKNVKRQKFLKILTFYRLRYLKIVMTFKTLVSKWCLNFLWRYKEILYYVRAKALAAFALMSAVQAEADALVNIGRSPFILTVAGKAGYAILRK